MSFYLETGHVKKFRISFSLGMGLRQYIFILVNICKWLKSLSLWVGVKVTGVLALLLSDSDVV